MLIKSYFEQKIHQWEKPLFGELLYCGHNQFVPRHLDYHVLENTDNRWTLINRNDDFFIQSNVCLHRQAEICSGKGRGKMMMCRAHCWTYDENGVIKGTPHFEEKIEGHLERRSLLNWEGVLFAGEDFKLDLKMAGVDHLIDFSKYKFHETTKTIYSFNWKTFAEVYLENLHIYAMHPGLRKFVDPQMLEWQFGERWSLQKIGVRPNLEGNDSIPYTDMIQSLKENGITPEFGAVWIYIYPNIMIEWYPKTIAISTIYSPDPETTINYVDLFFEEGTTDEFKEIFSRVYEETALEDEDACNIIHRGRKALWLSGENQIGPIQPKLEAGVKHFWDWYKRTC
jgi:phenylpropionate dioxygenase-like ring-hydroxylating dioxygenase large terminal subunit